MIFVLSGKSPVSLCEERSVLRGTNFTGSIGALGNALFVLGDDTWHGTAVFIIQHFVNSVSCGRWLGKSALNDACVQPDEPEKEMKRKRK